MNILAIGRTLPFHSIGGMQAVAWDLLREFARQGHSVTVLTTTIPGKPERFESEGVAIVTVVGTKAEKYSRRWWSGSRAAAQSIFASAPDVVLSISSAGAGLLPLNKLWAHVPFVMQAHGTSLGEVQSKWRSGRMLQRARSVRNIYWLIKDLILYRHVDQLILVGDVIEGQFRSPPLSWWANGTPRQVIRNGVDRSLFRPNAEAREAGRKRFGWAPTDKVLVFAARLHPQKGVHEALKVYELLRQTDPTLRLLLIGGGEEEAAVKAWIDAQGGGDSVRMSGSVPREQVAELLVVGDVFLFPTLRQEGLPLNVLEAMSCGLHAVCAESMRDVFDASLPIRYAPPKDHARFAEAVRLVLREGAYQAGDQMASYSLTECAASYLKSFERLKLNGAHVPGR